MPQADPQQTKHVWINARSQVPELSERPDVINAVVFPPGVPAHPTLSLPGVWYVTGS